MGNLDIDYLVEVQEDGLAELSAKIFAHKTDRITLKKAVILRGARSRSLIKTRVVLEDEARAEITGTPRPMPKEPRPCGLRGNRAGPSPGQRDPDREGLSPGGESHPRSCHWERG